MKEKERKAFEQGRRILFIIKRFQRDKIVLKKELLESMLEDFPTLKARSLERDLQVMQDEGFIISYKKGKESYWELVEPIKANNLPNLKITEHEMLSFYALKAYLKTFKGTSIEDDVNSLSKKIALLAPGEAIIEDTLYWAKSIGAYDYSSKNQLIGDLLRHINEKNWLKLTYQRMSDMAVRDYDIFPQGLYSYSGSIYLIAYQPKYQKFIDFAVHNIIKLEELNLHAYQYPKFDYDEYQKTKFAVFSGEPVTVKIKIFEEAVKYFENRFWHITQKVEYDREFNMILTMEVPITPDLIGMLLYWLRSTVVLEPQELKDKVKEAIEWGRGNYE